MKCVICPVCKTEFEIPRCEFCKHLDLESKTSVGYECTCPDKNWPRRLSRYKSKNQVACRYYIADLNRINQNVGVVVKNESKDT